MTDLVIRADADTRMGTGHVMRCLALAQAWRSRGGRAALLGRCDGEALRQRVRDAGVEMVVLEQAYPAPSDEKALRSLVATRPGAWVVIDGYHFDGGYQRAVRQEGCRLLVIDDLAQQPEYDADVLLNQNLGAAFLPYVCDRETILLLGTRYALLRPEFRARRDSPRLPASIPRRILVTMGGGDPDGVTAKVLSALSDEEGLEIKVVAGYTNPRTLQLRNLAGGMRSPAEVLSAAGEMAPLMEWADLAISAGGSTCWELACMGVPLVVITLADNQRRVGTALQEAGVAIHLGWHEHVATQDIRDALVRARRDGAWRTSARVAGRRLADGQGAERLVDVMEDPGNNRWRALRMRTATADDAAFLWTLANDPNVRRNSFSPDPIPWASHVSWLDRKLASAGTRVWILEVGGDPAGQVRCDMAAPDAADIDFAIAPAYRGRGLGSRLLAMAAEEAGRVLPVRRVRGVVKEGNPASASAFWKAGFECVAGQERVHEHLCAVFQKTCAGRN